MRRQQGRQDEAHSPRCGQRALGHPTLLPACLLLPRAPGPRSGSLHLAGRTVLIPSGTVCCPFSCEIPHSLHCHRTHTPLPWHVLPCAWVRPGLELPEARVDSHSALRPGLGAGLAPMLSGARGALADRGQDACLLGLSLVWKEEGQSSEPAGSEGTQSGSPPVVPW